MTLPFTVDSQAFVPWNESGFTYTSKRNSGDVTITLPRCAFYPGRIGQGAPSNAVFTQSDAEATFGFSDIAGIGAGYDPKPGDTLTRPGKGPRVVLFVREAPMMQFWSVTTRDLRIAYDLQDLCTVRRSTPSPDARGFRTRNESDVYTDVPCRVQPTGTRNDVGEDRVDQTATYTAILGQAILLRAGDTIVLGDEEYEVTEQSDISQFDTLTKATCERRR